MKDVELSTKTWRVDSATLTSNGKYANCSRLMGYISIIGVSYWGFRLVVEQPNAILFLWLSVIIGAIALFEKVSRCSLPRQIDYKLEDSQLILIAKANSPTTWLSMLFRGLWWISITFAIALLIFCFELNLGAELIIASVTACIYILWQSYRLFNPTNWKRVERTLHFEYFQKSRSRIWLKSNLASKQIHLFSTLSFNPISLCFTDEHELKCVREFLIERHPEVISVVNDKYLMKWIF